MNFTFFNWLKKKLRIYSDIEYNMKFRFQCPKIQFSWHMTTPISLYSVCGCFSATKAGLSIYDRDCLALKAKNIYYLVFYRENCVELRFNVKGEKHFAKGETEAQRAEMNFSKLHISEGLLLCQIIQTLSPVLQRKRSKHTDEDLHTPKVTWGTGLEGEICHTRLILPSVGGF